MTKTIAMRTSNSRFQRGSGTYICGSCGKRTRATGQGEEGCGLCATCYERAGDENAVSDGQMTQESFDAKWQASARQVSSGVALTDPGHERFDVGHLNDVRFGAYDD